MVIGESPYTRVLTRAAETLGGVQHLADDLRVPPHLLQRWLSGEEAPPFEAFSRALDIVAHGPLR